MNAFTDEDLKRLKEMVAYISETPKVIHYEQPLQIGGFRALLARLEAAERVIAEMDKRGPTAQNWQEIAALETAWLESCGKGSEKGRSK